MGRNAKGLRQRSTRPPMRIATWTLNSVRSRLEQVSLRLEACNAPRTVLASGKSKV